MKGLIWFSLPHTISDEAIVATLTVATALIKDVDLVRLNRR